jgi:hypothetical protein
MIESVWFVDVLRLRGVIRRMAAAVSGSVSVPVLGQAIQAKARGTKMIMTSGPHSSVVNALETGRSVVVPRSLHCRRTGNLGLRLRISTRVLAILLLALSSASAEQLVPLVSRVAPPTNVPLPVSARGPRTVLASTRGAVVGGVLGALAGVVYHLSYVDHGFPDTAYITGLIGAAIGALFEQSNTSHQPDGAQCERCAPPGAGDSLTRIEPLRPCGCIRPHVTGARPIYPRVFLGSRVTSKSPV